MTASADEGLFSSFLGFFSFSQGFSLFRLLFFFWCVWVRLVSAILTGFHDCWPPLPAPLSCALHFQPLPNRGEADWTKPNTL